MRGRFRDRTGERYGRLLVIRQAPTVQLSRWVCKCDCGNEVTVYVCHLTTGHTKSCGCFRSEVTSARDFKHGLSRTKLYVRWKGIISRCTDKNNKSYRYYGGRGIRVCKRWLNFENFLSDMGYPPPGAIIDREDNNGDYTPENCRWVQYKQSARNTRKNRFIKFNGETRTAVEWSEITGIAAGTILARVRMGWSEERIFLPTKTKS